MSTQKNTIVIENPHQGWSRSLTGSTESAVRRIGGTDRNYAWSAAGVTLMRSGYEGHMTPGFVFDALTDATPKVNELPLNAAVTSATNTPVWVMLRNARMVKFDMNDDTVDTIRTAIDIGLTLPEADNHDILTHRNSAGAEKIFYSYDTSDLTTKSDIGIMANDGNTIDDDFFSSRTGGARLEIDVPLKMWVGPDSNVYCTNGRYVAVYDTLTDRANAQALDLGAGWVATSGIKYQNYNVIVAYKAETGYSGGGTTNFSWGQVRVIFWNGYDPRYNYQYDIPDNKSGAIELFGDELRVYTAGRSRSTKCWKFQGDGFGKGPLFETPSTSISIPIHGQVGQFRNHTIFPSYNAANYELFAYGANDPQVELPGLHSITPNNTGWGFVKELRSNMLFVGSKDGASSWSIRKLNEAKYGDAGVFYSRNYPLPRSSTIERIRFYFSLFDASQSLDINIYKNGNGSSTAISETLTQAELGNTYYHTITNQITDVNSVCLSYKFNTTSSTSGIAIRRIEIDYSYETNTI